MKSYELYCLRCGFDLKTKLKKVPAFLDGPVLAAYNAIPATDRDPSHPSATWDEVCKGLLNALNTEDRCAHFLCAFSSRKQLDGESFETVEQWKG